VTVAVSTVAAGAAAYGVYALVRNRRRAVGAAKQAVVTPAVTIEKSRSRDSTCLALSQSRAAAMLRCLSGPLSPPPEHIDYIGDKAQEYCGGDRDAVVRVILDYASTQGDEKLIFETVRCNTCGGKASERPRASATGRQVAPLLTARWDGNTHPSVRRSCSRLDLRRRTRPRTRRPSV
jgi:hypothetical protein